MKIAIVGAGAIGGLLGARLSLSGQDVALIARNRNLLAIEQHGLRLLEDDGRELHAPRVRAYADGSDAGPQDAVLLAVKAHQVKDVLPAMQGLLGPETAVVTMSNGLPWWYFQRLPGPYENRVLESVDPGGAIAAAIDPGRVIGSVVELGRITGVPTPSIEAVHHLAALLSRTLAARGTGLALGGG